MNTYELVTNRLIEAMEAGMIPWRQPWKACNDGCRVPTNKLSGKAYRGINTLLLSCAPYASKMFMTYKQAAEMGGHVRKGESGWPVVFWKFDRNKSDDGKWEKSVLMRYYTVFNLEQIDGLTERLPLPLPEFNPIAAAETVKAGYFDAAGAPALHHGGNEAFYRPSNDSVWMPQPAQFQHPEGYYKTLFHEAAHSTGHSSRLDRKDGMNTFFGDHSYSKEELVAEFAAAFLCAECGISNEYTEQNSAAYLQSWIHVFKGDKTIAVSAAQRAQKAADCILGRLAAAESEAIAA